MSTATAPVHRSAAGEVAAFLDRCEAQLVHPAVVEDQLRRAGWPDVQAAGEAERYRRRFEEHGLGYAALFVATGVAALAAGTSVHLAAAACTGPVDRRSLATWLTVLITAAPFAAWAHWWAAEVDRDDPVAVWSRPRRSLAQVLVGASIVVGIGRLVAYTFQLLVAVLGADPGRSNAAAVLQGFLNVLATVAIAGGIGAWAWGVLHRFDAEDPSRPVRRTRRPTTPRSALA